MKGLNTKAKWCVALSPLLWCHRPLPPHKKGWCVLRSAYSCPRMPTCFCSHLCLGMEVPHGHTSSCHCREAGKHCLCSLRKEINLRQKFALREPTAVCLEHLSKSSSRQASLAKNMSLLPLQAWAIPTDMQPEIWAGIRSLCFQIPPSPRKKWELTLTEWKVNQQVPLAGAANLLTAPSPLEITAVSKVSGSALKPPTCCRAAGRFAPRADACYMG